MGFDSKATGYPSALISNTFALENSLSGIGHKNFQVVSSKISVSEEFLIYDLSSILGSLRGLRFSFGSIYTCTDLSFNKYPEAVFLHMVFSQDDQRLSLTCLQIHYLRLIRKL
jgi:hypothetical protein